jgi:hypothetical protein
MAKNQPQTRPRGRAQGIDQGSWGGTRGIVRVLGIEFLIIAAVALRLLKRRRSRARDAATAGPATDRPELSDAWVLMLAVVGALAILAALWFVLDATTIPYGQPGSVWDYTPFRYRLGWIGVATAVVAVAVAFALRRRSRTATLAAIGALIVGVVLAALNLTWKPSVPDATHLGRTQFATGSAAIDTSGSPPVCRTAQQLRGQRIWPLGDPIGRFTHIHRSGSVWAGDITADGDGVPVYVVNVDSIRYLVAMKAPGCHIVYDDLGEP